jgi:hypothetical protein
MAGRVAVLDGAAQTAHPVATSKLLRPTSMSPVACQLAIPAMQTAVADQEPLSLVSRVHRPS